MGEKYYVGTSGWVYPHWRNVFYPPKLARSKWLEFYTDHLSSVELNNSFYRLPSERSFSNWRDTSPDGFRYAVKVSRFITHMKRLKDVAGPLGLPTHIKQWGRVACVGGGVGTAVLYPLAAAAAQGNYFHNHRALAKAGHRQKPVQDKDSLHARKSDELEV